MNALFRTVSLLFGILPLCTLAQGDHEHHEHPPNELGVANSAVFFPGEEEWSYGLHLHFLRTIGHSRFRLGAGYERIFDVHKHNTVGVVAGYAPAHGWTVIVSPGIAFEDADPGALLPAVHLETTYEFDLGPLHLGPVLEWAWDPEDTHVSIGLHLGIGLGKHHEHP